MRHRWIQAAQLGSAILAAVVLAASPVSGVAARTEGNDQSGSLRAFWDQQGSWRDQTTQKALRATRQTGSWEVLVGSKNGEWKHQGYLEEVYRRRPESSINPDEALKGTLDSLGMVTLIGKVEPTKGSTLYIVAAVLEQDNASQDSEGRILKPFVPLHVNESYQGALRFAQVYSGIINTGEPLDSPPGSPAPQGLDKVVGCETRCANQQMTGYAYCNSEYSSCLSNASWILLSCNVGCLGNPVCRAGCSVYYVYLRGSCVQSQQDCQSLADDNYYTCIAGCSFGGGGAGGCSATNHTATVGLSLDGTTGAEQKATSSPVDFPLSRSEKRSGESFVLDEWVVFQDGQVRVSSNPAFAVAVTDQHATPDLGSFLMIQEPIHEMNNRYVPKPEVLISEKALAPSERGTGEIVAARLELSPTKVVDRVEILYTSKPMDAGRLEKLISRRVGLAFASEKGHRTAVYMVFRLTDRLEILRTYTVLPKCCCGGVHCV